METFYMTKRLLSLFMKNSNRFNSALAITGAIRGSSREKLYQELGFESLQQRRWYRKAFQNDKKPISQVPL